MTFRASFPIYQEFVADVGVSIKELPRPELTVTIPTMTPFAVDVDTLSMLP